MVAHIKAERKLAAVHRESATIARANTTRAFLRASDPRGNGLCAGFAAALSLELADFDVLGFFPLSLGFARPTFPYFIRCAEKRSTPVQRDKSANVPTMERAAKVKAGKALTRPLEGSQPLGLSVLFLLAVPTATVEPLKWVAVAMGAEGHWAGTVWNSISFAGTLRAKSPTAALRASTQSIRVHQGEQASLVVPGRPALNGRSSAGTGGNAV